MFRFLFTVLFVFCLVPCVFAGPLIQVSPAVIDMGTMYSGEKSEQVFVIENRGDEPLIINKVRTSCGCTTAFMRDKMIAPGQSTELAVRFNSAKFRGQVVKRIMLFSNDPSGRTELVLRGQVKVELQLEPSQVKLGIVPTGKVIERVLKLKNLSDQAVEEIVLRCTSRQMRVENVPTRLAAGDSAELKLVVTVPATMKAPVNGYLLISGQGRTRNQLRVSVVGKAGATL